MITVRQKKITVENSDQKVVYYPDLFSGPIITEIANKLDQKSLASLTVGLAMITQKIYKPRVVENQIGSLACIILESDLAFFEKDKEKIEVPCQPGSVFILGSIFRQKWTFKLPLSSIKLYEDNYLPGIYLSTKQRFLYGEKVKKSLSFLHQFPEWQQCLNKKIPLELIGQGSYGNVFKSGYSSQTFAVKFSKLKPEAVAHPYDISYASWHEVHFLTDIFKPLIEKNICPNLPLIYDSFTCKNCDIIIDDKKVNTPCVITVIELASGTLKDYLQTKRTVENVKSALFQIMAAIHTIQLYAQVMNFDVKKENILYYEVEPGGYWIYTIRDQDYYVPNFGQLFVLNDFGISRPMSPKHPVHKTPQDKSFRLGSRYAVVKDGKFVPFDTIKQADENGNFENPFLVKWKSGQNSLGAEYRINRETDAVMKNPIFLTDELKIFLKEQNIPTSPNSHGFFEHPEIIPPFEFYNDTQDAIRMFAGGKRTTQKGQHKSYTTIPQKFVDELESYIGPADSAKDRTFSHDPAQVLAGYFIESFFPVYKTVPKNAKIIARYTI